MISSEAYTGGGKDCVAKYGCENIFSGAPLNENSCVRLSYYMTLLLEKEVARKDPYF